MTDKKQDKKKFYKEKGFWAAVFSGIGGILAGNAGAVDGIMSIFNYIFGG